MGKKLTGGTQRNSARENDLTRDGIKKVLRNLKLETELNYVEMFCPTLLFDGNVCQYRSIDRDFFVLKPICLFIIGREKYIFFESRISKT